LTPAAASARLAKLEAQVSTRLFERSTRRLRLTDEGRLYLNCCRQALQALDDADAMLQEGRNVVSGKVRLSSTADFGRNQLLDWLDEFNARYPDVTFSVTASDSSSNLWQDEIDLAIRFAAPPDGALIARPLAANRRVLCASPAFVDKYGTPKDPLDLARFPCNVITVASGPINVWRFTRGGDTQTYTVPLANAHETNDGGLTREWTIRGHGIALKSIWDIARDVRAGRLKVLLPEWRHQDAPLHAIHHSKRYMAPRVRVLLDFLVERFAQEEKALEDLLNACR
ncbi:LysR family transcriptional regulator, partial [Burkholderia thailandensis]